MLHVTKKVEYSLIALVYMAKESGKSVSAREIAVQNAIPLSLTANILKLLAKTGMVATRRGAAGGYSLEKSTDSVTLGDVMEAVGGPMHITACCRDQGHAGCGLVGSCSIKSSILQLNNRLMESMHAISLTEFLNLGRREPLVNIGRRHSASAFI